MQFPALISTVVFALLATAQPSTLAAQSRVDPHANLSTRTRLTGHLVPWATHGSDIGQANDATPLHITLLLARTSALQAAFDQLLADQQNPSSSTYHQWLTPAQIGDRFGPSLDEIASVTQWLSSQGLQVTAVSPSRTFLDVIGTTASASAAFSTTFHLYAIPGDTQPLRLAATIEPSIPAALAPIIRSIEGLTDIPFRSFHNVAIAEPHPIVDTLHPLTTTPSGVHYIFPGDFAKIYDIAATTSAGYDGTGVKVAIAGQSRITSSDITQLQVMAGLPAKAPNTVLVPSSADPGLVKGDEDESTLDVSRALTIAPGIQADLVIAASASGGVSTAIQYAVNTLVDPILSISYGACETATNASSIQFYDTLFAQAAAQGITTLVSSGDSAAAGCSASFSTPTGKETRAMGNYLCSSSYVTCVGGTEFADAGLDTTYWATTNSGTYVSALGYIPEGAWNEPTVTSSTGVVSYQIAGSGSGPSAYIAKPTWQTGTGVPADAARDIPDIAFTTANHDGYFACLAYVGSSADCSKGGGVIFSGTSASAPDMAGIAALLNQRLGAKQGNLNPLLYRLAASNPPSFHDATPATSHVANCTTATASLCNNSVPLPTSVTGGLAGYPLQVGYDLVTGLGSLDVTNFLTAAAVPIAASTITLTAPTTTLPAGQSLAITATVAAGSSNSTPTGTIQFSAPGISTTTTVPLSNGSALANISFNTPGTYAVTAAYAGDANFQSSTSSPLSVTVTAAGTTTTLTLAPSFLATGASTVLTAKVAATGAATLTPGGTVGFYANGAAIGAVTTLSSGTATSSPIAFSASGTYTITAVYSGDANNLPSTSPSTTLTVAAAGSTQTTVATTTPSIIPGATASVSARTIGTSSQAPTGTIQFLASGIVIAPAASLVNGAASLTYTGFTTPGTYAITAAYSGDTANAASTSTPTTIIVTKYTTLAATITASASAFSTAQTTVIKIALSIPTTSAPAPTGTIQLYANGTAMGSPIAISGQTATSPALIFPAAGTYAITAVYTGDTSYAAVNLTGPSLTVTLPTITVASSPATLSLTSGAATGNTSTLTVGTPNGLTGSVTLACAITSMPASAINLPTCSISASSVTLTGESASAVLTLSTTVPHATQPTTSLSQSTPYRTPQLLPLSLAGLAFVLPLSLRRARSIASRLLLLLFFASAVAFTGCTSSVSGSAPATTSNPVLIGTTTGAYAITVTATAAVGASTTTVVTLNVQ